MRCFIQILLFFEHAKAQENANSVHTVIAGQGRPAHEEEQRWQNMHQGSLQQRYPLLSSRKTG
jgi:hypothetical protein